MWKDVRTCRIKVGDIIRVYGFEQPALVVERNTHRENSITYIRLIILGHAGRRTAFVSRTCFAERLE